MFLQPSSSSRPYVLLDVEQVDVGGSLSWVAPHRTVASARSPISSQVPRRGRYVLRPACATTSASAALGCWMSAATSARSPVRSSARSGRTRQVIAAEPEPNSAALFRKNTGGDGRRLPHRGGAPRPRRRPGGRVPAGGPGQPGRQCRGEPGGGRRPAARRPGVLGHHHRAGDVRDRSPGAAHGNPVIDLRSLDICEGAQGEILQALRHAGRLARARAGSAASGISPPTPFRVAEALRETHEAHVDPSDGKRGAFIAHRRL